MFGKVKRWLGIEGVKLEILLPEETPLSGQMVRGKLRFTTMHTQTIKEIQVKLVEKYTRGRGNDKLIDEYTLGEITLNRKIEIPEGEFTEIDFELPFTMVLSDMEESGRRNPLQGGFVWAAKKIFGVQSEFRVEAEAKVEGTALHPFDRKNIVFK